MSIDYETIFCHVDDFCKGFLPWWHAQLVDSGERQRDRETSMALSEMITILITFHQSGYKCFMYYYKHLYINGRSEFPIMLSYSRFITLIKRCFPVLIALFEVLKGEANIINYIDSTKYEVCKVIRANRHKVFKGIAIKSKTSTGWFFGLKLHFIFNLSGEIVKLVITPGNIDDRNPVSKMIKNIYGKIFADRGYISQERFEEWFASGVQVITGIKKNMKNKLMHLFDKFMLRRRGFVETIFSSIKSLGTFEHSRHRCVVNALCHIFCGLIAYQLRDDKPSLINELQLST